MRGLLGSIVANVFAYPTLFRGSSSGSRAFLDTGTNLFGGFTSVAAVGTAVWTGGLAVSPGSGRAYMTFDDPTVGNTDAVRAVNLGDLTTVVWTFTTAIDDDPTTVIAPDDTFNRLYYHRGGPDDVEELFSASGTASSAHAITAPGAIASANLNQRVYISQPAGNNVFVVAPGSIVTTIGSLTGANGLDGTKP
jgi:hypothetical protein